VAAAFGGDFAFRFGGIVVSRAGLLCGVAVQRGGVSGSRVGG